MICFSCSGGLKLPQGWGHQLIGLSTLFVSLVAFLDARAEPLLSAATQLDQPREPCVARPIEPMPPPPAVEMNGLPPGFPSFVSEAKLIVVGTVITVGPVHLDESRPQF